MNSNQTKLYRRTLIIAAALTALAGILGACSLLPGGEPTPEPTESMLPGTTWYLVSYGPVENPTPVVPGSSVTLEFGEVDQVVGSGGCNSFGGTFQAQDGEISFSSVASTLMACADQAVMEQEAAYFEALNNAESYFLTDEGLTIFYGDEQALRFVDAPPAPPSSSAGVSN